MSEDIHPGSFVGDTVEEFKKLPTWGKILVGVIGVVVLYVGYRILTSKGSAPTSGGSLPPTSNSAGSQSPFPSVASGNSSVPLLPNNVNPVYDQSGGLTAFQQAAPSTPATNNPITAIAGYLGLLGPNAHINIAKSGLASDSTYVNSQGQTVSLSSVIPGSDKVTQGSENRVWYTDSGGQHLLTSGTGPAIDPTTNTPAVTNQQNTQTTVNKNTGGGGQSWQSMIRRLNNYHPQRGDNMSEVAFKLGLNGWKSFNVDSFEHGNPVRIPREIM